MPISHRRDGHNHGNISQKDDGHNHGNFSQKDDGHNDGNLSQKDDGHNHGNFSQKDDGHNHGNISQKGGEHNHNDPALKDADSSFNVSENITNSPVLPVAKVMIGKISVTALPIICEVGNIPVVEANNSRHIAMQYAYHVTLSWLFLYVIPLAVLFSLNILLIQQLRKAHLMHAEMTHQDLEQNNTAVTLSVIVMVGTYLPLPDSRLCPHCHLLERHRPGSYNRLASVLCKHQSVELECISEFPDLLCILQWVPPGAHQHDVSVSQTGGMRHKYFINDSEKKKYSSPVLFKIFKMFSHHFLPIKRNNYEAQNVQMWMTFCVRHLMMPHVTSRRKNAF